MLAHAMLRCARAMQLQCCRHNEIVQSLCFGNIRFFRFIIKKEGMKIAISNMPHNRCIQPRVSDGFFASDQRIIEMRKRNGNIRNHDLFARICKFCGPKTHFSDFPQSMTRFFVFAPQEWMWTVFRHNSLNQTNIGLYVLFTRSAKLEHDDQFVEYDVDFLVIHFALSKHFLIQEFKRRQIDTCTINLLHTLSNAVHIIKRSLCDFRKLWYRSQSNRGLGHNPERTFRAAKQSIQVITSH
mmetsp:Transcript_5346/g.8759  ORF Transcript_5346/g.8759 Transcript_5346/m.8759 type:complete len:240 (-) Transcript_5346:734-1453(-)